MSATNTRHMSAGTISPSSAGFLESRTATMPGRLVRPRRSSGRWKSYSCSCARWLGIGLGGLGPSRTWPIARSVSSRPRAATASARCHSMPRWWQPSPSSASSKRPRARQPGTAYRAGLAALDWYTPGDEYVITDELGIPVHPEWYSDEFARLLKRVGLRKIRLHDSRHTTLSLMEKAKAPISVISKWAGHYDAAFTMRTLRPRERRRPDDR